MDSRIPSTVPKWNWNSYVYPALRNAEGEKRFPFPLEAPSFDYDLWAEKIEEAYGPAAPGVLELEKKIGKNSDQEVLGEERLSRNMKKKSFR